MRNWLRKNKTPFYYILIFALVVYFLFFPSLTPELAVRKSLLVSHPIHAVSAKVDKGKIDDDPRYGDLYYVSKAELSFVYVKKNRLGWYVTTSGTGP
ncbi:hypothetical protein [Cohnella lupini]|uniref:Uncharacterized protein n=1 Tax=Cohnella lupini TaxID=1294267 RepID=A0A3D9IWW1_9BACL|nr:hypothetical protein [Cohnella lupini]RED66195.1 hypothetical protein DFP95_101693 [Cohnella lupini]